MSRFNDVISKLHMDAKISSFGTLLWTTPVLKFGCIVQKAKVLIMQDYKKSFSFKLL